MPLSPTRPVTGSGAAGLRRGRGRAGRRLSIWRGPRLLRQRLELDLPPLGSDITHRAPPRVKNGITAKPRRSILSPATPTVERSGGSTHGGDGGDGSTSPPRASVPYPYGSAARSR